MKIQKAILLFIVTFSLAACISDNNERLSLEILDNVNVFIGTTNGGNTTPAACAPFGMISCGPTSLFNASDLYNSRSGYDYAKDSIANFSLTHVSGWGCHGALDIPFMPVSAKPVTSPVFNPASYASSFSHADEFAIPGYYEVYLADVRMGVKTASAERAAIMEITKDEDGESYLVFAPTNASNGITAASLEVHPDLNRITGFGTSGGFCWRDPSLYDYTVYFVAECSKEITSYGFWRGNEMLEGAAKSLEGNAVAGYVGFEQRDEPLVIRIAISFVSVENAIGNLEHELAGHSLTSLKKETARKWAEGLGKMRVESPDEDLKVQMYTALYHNMLHPNIFNDVNGEYVGFDDQVYTIDEGRNKYVNFSNWDTYRTTAQLQGLLFPEQAADMIHSLYLDSKQGCPAGFPIWGYFNNETFVMNGYSGLPLIANLYAFGGRNIALEEVKDQMVWAANSQYRSGEEYIEHGYVPDEPGDHNYSVSMTLEYSIDDYAVASMCRYAGDSAQYRYFNDRSGSVFNLFNPELGYLQRRDAGGEWVFPFDSASDAGFNEGNAAQYTWNVPHDLPGLVDRMGGTAAAEMRLDHFTSKILIEGWNVEVPFYWPANQPSFIAPFVYNFVGKPEKAQSLLWEVTSSIFSNSPGGLPGNDDLGATSAMYLFAVAGLYPLVPGVPEFTLTGPIAERVEFYLDNGKVIVSEGDSRAKPVDDKPYTSIFVNGALWQDHLLDIGPAVEGEQDMLIRFAR